MLKFVCKISLSILIVAVIACSPKPTNKYVDVTAKDFQFVCADSIPSGWNTFRFTNTGHAEHFFLLNYLPDSISFERYHQEVTKPFDFIFDSLKAGKTKEEAGALLGTMLPAWYFTDVKQMGGTGIVSMHHAATVTMNLKPGTYVMECYIKEKGVFHTAFGMIKPITVTNEVSTNEEPSPNVDINLTNFNYDITGELKSGTNIIAVHFQEHPQFSLGNDLQVIQMTDSTNLDSVIQWLDWMNIKGLESPAPATFIGGTQEMPIGYSSYITIDLKPGRYTFLAESAASKGMIHEFEIK